MKFIFFTDLHGRSNNPISRKDDYPSTILEKVEWVIKKAEEEEAEILFGGDWLNRPDTSPHFIGKLARTLLKHNKPIYTVLGNHDVYGYNPSTFPRTPLYILEEVGMIQRLYLDKPFIMMDTLNDNSHVIYITGQDSIYDIDKENKKGYLPKMMKQEAKDFHIHVVHGFLTNTNWPNVDTTLIKDITHTNADVTLCGHEHSGFPVTNIDGKIFANPGSLARVTAGVGDVSLEVKVALIDTQKRTVEYIKCDIAKSSKEVIDSDKLEREKEHEKNMQSFFSSLSEVDIEDISGKDVFAIFNDFSKKENIEDKVKSEILKRLEVAQVTALKGEEE